MQRHERRPRVGLSVINLFALLVCAAGLAVVSAHAQDSGTTQDVLRPPAVGPKSVDPDHHLLMNATVHIAPGAEPFVGWVEIRGDRIIQLWTRTEAAMPPASARQWDASGLHIYPAFVESYLPVSLPQRAAPASALTHHSPTIHAHRSALETDVPERTAEALRELGFGAAHVAPDSGILRGATAVVSLAEAPSDRSAPRPPVLRDTVMHAAGFDRASGRDEYPRSRIGAIAVMRQALHDVGWLESRRASGGTVEPTPLDGLTGRGTPLLMQPDNEIEAIRASEVAAEFDRDAVIVGVGTGYQAIEAAARSKHPRIVPLTFPEAPTVDSVGQANATSLSSLMAWEQAPTNPRRLLERGIDVALTTHGLDKRSELASRVRLAIAHGLSEADALAALTTAPAEMLGLGDELGTLDANKRANLIVATGPIFDKDTEIRDVWIDGCRHEISTPDAAFDGEWDATLVGRFKFALEIENGGKKVTVIEEDVREKASSVKIDGDAISFVFDHERFGTMGGYFTMSARLDGDALRGHGTRSDGKHFDWVAERLPPSDGDNAEEDQDGDPSTDERRAADVPDELPRPFSPYGLVGAVDRAETLAITNATLWTCAEQPEVMENAAVVIHDGRIAFVGSADDVRDFVSGWRFGRVTAWLDAEGRHLTPGLIDCHSHTAMALGINEGGQAVSAEVRISDTIDHRHVNWYRQLAGGVTAVNSLHGSANPIGGQNAVHKIRWGSPSSTEMVFAEAPAGIKFALGENVKQSNWGQPTGRYPQTRMGVEALILDRFHAAGEYAARHAAHRAGRGPAPRIDLELEALAEVLSGDRLIHCHSYRQDEILMLARLCQSFGVIIGTYQHGLECYKVADAVRESSRGASLFSDWWAFKIEVQDAIPYGGAILHEQGVVVSFNSDDNELARRMNTEAAKAVRYGGVEPAEALKFVTLNPAKQLAVDEHVGSIEVGKHADLALWSGSPLSSMSRCEATWVDGKRLFDLERDALMREAIAQERARLIQKILRLAAPAKPKQNPEEAPGPDEDVPPPSIWAQRALDMTRERALEHLRAGRDPNCSQRGECGCVEEMHR